MTTVANTDFTTTFAIRQAPVEVLEEKLKDAGEEKPLKWIIEGYAATTELATDDAVITKEALEAAVTDLSKRSTVLLNHNPDEAIGTVLESGLREKESGEHGIWVRIRISKTRADIWEQIREGVLNKFSFRGRINAADEAYSDDLKKMVRTITSITLMEVSVVSVPADAGAEIASWKVERKKATEGGENHMADETKRDSEATPKLDEVLSGISERLDTLSESVRSLHETVSSSAEDTTREAADEDKQKMLSLLERIWEALNTTQATEVAEETAEPVAETAERNDQPAIFAPLRRAAAAKLQGVLDATDTDASTKIMVEGAVNYLTRTLTKEQLRREEDDNTTADLTKPLSVLQSVVSTLPKEHPAFASVQTAIQLISGENASTPTPEVTPEDEVETSTEATESIEVTALKAELSELRSAIDNVQVVRGVARPITPMDPSSPFASDDYQNLEPSEKAGVLASMIAKGRPNETK